MDAGVGTPTDPLVCASLPNSGSTPETEPSVNGRDEVGKDDEIFSIEGDVALGGYLRDGRSTHGVP